MQTDRTKQGRVTAGVKTLGSEPNHSNHCGKDRLSSETIHNLRAPLTIIKAQAQLLERWVHRNAIADADVVLTRLEVIETMVARLVGELDELRGTPPSQQQADASENDAGET